MPSKTLSVLIAISVAVLLSACGTKLERPPIEVDYRKSLLGAGNIVQLENRTNEPIRELVVEIRSTAGTVSYEVAELGGFEMLEVGWKKLGGFQIPDDAEIEIRAKGYFLPLHIKLAETKTGKDGSR